MLQVCSKGSLQGRSQVFWGYILSQPLGEDTKYLSGSFRFFSRELDLSWILAEDLVSIALLGDRVSFGAERIKT